MDHDYSIIEFCEAERISRSFFYKLLAQGKAPRVMKLGRRRIVTRQARDDWRREREAESDA